MTLLFLILHKTMSSNARSQLAADVHDGGLYTSSLPAYRTFPASPQILPSAVGTDHSRVDLPCHQLQFICPLTYTISFLIQPSEQWLHPNCTRSRTGIVCTDSCGCTFLESMWAQSFLDALARLEKVARTSAK